MGYLPKTVGLKLKGTDCSAQCFGPLLVFDNLRVVENYRCHWIGLQSLLSSVNCELQSQFSVGIYDINLILLALV